ncbi:hypothetical protein EGY05_02140 [Chryseobacterium arthrosphaerae]|uniref:hypothetical protein n=1 Tax=Chryseobacterium arthrosphaerae TaxID=651561 RepID=UPI000F4E9FB8|nr:hypothetical protein [Chryseobacterium arthrosphaerae]AYZ10814.1 hypothetical protein EGY05_02140 [Chryseobacterium arthrosphaerae]
MSIKKNYYYFFYKIYKSVQYTSKPFGDFLLKFRAGIIMIALQIFALASLGIYYSIITQAKMELSIFMAVIYIPLIIIIAFNYYSLDYLDIWKEYNKEFDNLPRKKNVLGSWIVFGIVLIIIGNFIFSFYCLDKQARKNQVGPYAPEIVAKEKREDSLQKAKQIENLKKIYGEDKK